MAHDGDLNALGWHGRDPLALETVALREHLQSSSGLVGLEILEPHEVERAVRIFRRDGFVVVRDVLTADQIEFLRAGVIDVVRELVALDDERKGNRGSHRYSFGGSIRTRIMLHRAEWQMLFDLPTVLPIIEAILPALIES